MTTIERKPRTARERQEPWQFQDAKAKLSEVLDRANEEGPQFITRRGGKGGVLISDEEYRHLKQSKTTLADVFRKAPSEIPYVRDTRPVIPTDLE